MIDERVVQAAKFWEKLRVLRVRSGLREDEFDQFALIVLGLVCLTRSPDLWPDMMANDMRYNFSVLMTAAHRDEHNFQQEWNDACNSLATVLRLGNQADARFEVGSLNEFRNIVGLIDSFESAWSSGWEMLLGCFDEVFHRVVGRLAAIGYRSGDTAAALAAHLSARVDHISEYFSVTGEFAVLRRSVFDVAKTARIAVIDRLNFIVDLRLYLHGIDVEDRSPGQDDFSSFSAGRFLLVDHPRRNTTGTRPHSPLWSDHQTSLEALDHLLRGGSNLDLSLIVVPGADRSAGGWRKELREHLVRCDLLLAVIDLPTERRDGPRKQVSAWLLSERSRPSNDVLMVDAKGLAGRGELSVGGVLMAFVAGIVSLGVQEGWPSQGLAGQSRSNSDVEAMLHAYFKDGYRDVVGVCRRIRPEELAENGYKLSASVYLERPGRRKTFMPRLNSEPVLKALWQVHDQGTRIYIIGNNGEGKSILLGDLAERLVEQGRRVVAISFGLTDRFPFERPKNDEQPFVYVGARTSEHGIALGRTSADVDRMVREIHTSAQRLDVFDAVVRHLGFGERRYLVPVDLKSSFDEDRTRYAELQQLTESVDDNARIFRSAIGNKYVLGLMRQESQSFITIFDELSSGEQQLLTLALKLTAYAGDNTVILVDEPELSLHVSWQRAIPVMLKIVGSRLCCSIVVATHSPVIVASATDSGDQCFVARRHVLTELSLRQRRSVETALFDGFRTYTANNRQVHERCAAMVSQAIQRLNVQSPLQDGDIATMESLHEELELMERIIRLADSAHLSHAREDLELVARTRAAIDELVAIERGNGV
ncbi:TPA: ATP-binding protein [Burkholderia cenocepacia]|uniref:AAA family ATPase n=1 Tax=Burkholderia cenocepacia TaxID=95486 RepID=UPI001B9495F3|nr:AAA family ATPase [Burkholderia cenocepacia]MBR8198662.1 ATP-binding protein [Burkholderia cenocepacia]HDV6325688.1 ATP-binding protein [Burkholderia cenocepacia]HDV6354126.1 ATP-binding protein [Burkholderia cenocepacia]